jgi:8-oxo-dGTP pyrophosphatase MutT (NUDIX family)
MSAPSWTPPDGLVADALRAIGAASAQDATERYERLAWAALLRTTGPALLTRASAPLHLTASAVVLDPDGEQTCLVLHHKIGLWVQPGGHLEDGDESVMAAAAREVMEETGLTGLVLPEPALLSRHPAPCAPGVVDWHLDVQFVMISDLTPPRPSDETPSVAWWPVDELPRDLAPGVAELVHSAAGMLAARSAAH